MKKGDSIIRDPEIRRIRALKMLERKVMGATHATIAKEFGVTQETVQRTFSWAKKAKLLAQLEDRLLENLLPSAATAVEKALEDTDKIQEAGKLGLDLMKLLVPSMKKAGPVAASSDDLAKYIADLRDGETEDVIDGEVEGDTKLLDPPAETSAPSQGDAQPSRGIPAGLESQPPESA